MLLHRISRGRLCQHGSLERLELLCFPDLHVSGSTTYRTHPNERMTSFSAVTSSKTMSKTEIILSTPSFYFLHLRFSYSHSMTLQYFCIYLFIHFHLQIWRLIFPHLMFKLICFAAFYILFFYASKTQLTSKSMLSTWHQFTLIFPMSLLPQCWCLDISSVTEADEWSILTCWLWCKMSLHHKEGILLWIINQMHQRGAPSTAEMITYLEDDVMLGDWLGWCHQGGMMQSLF